MRVTQRLEKTIEREAPSWGVRPVPDEHRRLRELDFAILWGDLGIGLLVLVTGALLVPALGLRQALAAIVVGSLVGCVPLALVGRAGAREGVPGMVLLRPTLGIRGSYLPTFLNVGQNLGWAGFELWAMALVASRLSARAFGFEGFHLWLAVAAVIVLALSLGGPVLVVRRWMERFGAWVIAGVAVWITIRLLLTADLGTLWSRSGEGGLPFWSAVDLVIVMPISWIPLVADYNRFARRDVSSAGGTYGGYLVANVWFYALGVLLVLGAGVPPFAGPAAIADGIVTLAGGVVVLLALLVGETDEAFANVYSASVSAQNVAPRLDQRAGIVVVAAVGVALAAWLFGLPDEGVGTYEFFLFLIGSVFVPLFAVFLADYFVLRRGRPYREDALFDPAGPYRFVGGYNLSAVGAWVLGFAAYHWIVPTGPGWWVRGVSTFFADWLRLPFPLFGDDPAVGASIPAFAVAFVGALIFGRLGRPRPGS